MEKYAAEEELIILRANFFRGRENAQGILCSILRARLDSQRFTQLIGSALSGVEGYSAEFLELVSDIWVNQEKTQPYASETPLDPPKMGIASRSTYQSVYKEAKIRIVWKVDKDFYLSHSLHS